MNRYGKDVAKIGSTCQRKIKYISVMLWVSHFAHTKRYLRILLTQLITYHTHSSWLWVALVVSLLFSIFIYYYFEDLLFAGWFEVFGSSHATPCTLVSLVCKICDKLTKEINMIILFPSFYLIVKQTDTWQQHQVKVRKGIEFSFYHHYLKILPYQSFVISKSCLTVYTICEIS